MKPNQPKTKCEKCRYCKILFYHTCDCEECHQPSPSKECGCKVKKCTDGSFRTKYCSDHDPQPEQVEDWVKELDNLNVEFGNNPDKIKDFVRRFLKSERQKVIEMVENMEKPEIDETDTHDYNQAILDVLTKLNHE